MAKKKSSQKTPKPAPQVRIFVTHKDGTNTLLRTVIPDEHKVIDHASPEELAEFERKLNARIKSAFEDLARQNPQALLAVAEEQERERERAAAGA